MPNSIRLLQAQTRDDINQLRAELRESQTETRRVQQLRVAEAIEQAGQTIH